MSSSVSFELQIAQNSLDVSFVYVSRKWNPKSCLCLSKFSIKANFEEKEKVYNLMTISYEFKVYWRAYMRSHKIHILGC